MAIEVISELLGGIKVLKPSVYKDERGYFIESYVESDFARLGLPTIYPQDNHSRSVRGVLRGLHFQWDAPQGKLLRVTFGAITLIEVDIRHNSPTVGQHIKLEVNDSNNHIIWIPPGFANGFIVTSGLADVQYKCTSQYNPKAESAIRWDSFGADWGFANPLVSGKDAIAQSLEQWLSRDESRNFSV